MNSCLEFLNRQVPEKIAAGPSVADAVVGIFELDIRGAGVWTIELIGQGRIREGKSDPNCGEVHSISMSKDDLARIISQPEIVWELFYAGELQVSNPCKSAALFDLFFPGAIARSVPRPLLVGLLPRAKVAG